MKKIALLICVIYITKTAVSTDNINGDIYDERRIHKAQ